MDKKGMMAAILAGMILLAGCGSLKDPTDNPGEVEGADWRTYRSYVDLDWNTPEGQKSMLAAVYDESGEIVLAPDQISYVPLPAVKIENGIHDIVFVQDNLSMKDKNGDGYGDLIVVDKIDGADVKGVYVYDPADSAFKYDADISKTE